MKTHRMGWAAAIVLAGLSGCAVVRSDLLPASESVNGVVYMLPRALLPVELTDTGEAFALTVQQPLLVGDSNRRFVLRRSGNPFSSDNVQIAVDPATGLLNSVKVSSEDQTLPTLVKLASAAAKPEGADQGTAPTLVFRGLFDPQWTSEEIDAFNVDMNKAATQYLEQRTSSAACAGAAASTPVATACANVRTLKDVVGTPRFAVKTVVAAASGASAPREVPAAPATDCSVGICYRLNLPHRITLSAPGVSNTVLAALPNGSPDYALPIERWAFVKTTHDVTLENGSLKSVTTDRPSSALALASAPVDAAKAVLGAVGEIVQLKVDLSGKEKALAEAKVAEIKAKADLDKELIKGSPGTAEAALFSAAPSRNRNRNAMATITVGAPAGRANALDGLQQGAPPAAGAASGASGGGRVSRGSQGSER